MVKRASRTQRLPMKYRAVPDIESGPTRYNEPALPPALDRIPSDKFQLGNTRADLRLRIERLLQRKEAVSNDAWFELGAGAPSLLVEMLNDEAVRCDEAILHRVISVVGQLSIQSGILPLSEILTDGSARPVTRAYAANALGRIGDAAAMEGLIAAAKVKDDMIRRQVAIALGRIDHPSVVQHLLRLQEDNSVAVAEVVAEPLRRWEEKLGRRSQGKQKATRVKSRPTTRPTRKRRPSEER